MAITTRAGLIAAAATAQRIYLNKTTSRTSVVNQPSTTFDVAGDPPAGVLPMTPTVNDGIIPTDATVGHPVIDPFVGTNTGYITRIAASSPVACVLTIYDVLWRGGPYAFNVNINIVSPSWASRTPTDGKTECELWVQTVTAWTGIPYMELWYTNGAGSAINAIGAPTVAPVVGQMTRLNHNVSQSGASNITSVFASTATAGTFEGLVLRKLWNGRIRFGNEQIVHGYEQIGLRRVYADSALLLVVTGDSTGTSTPEVAIDIANG